MPGPSSTDTFSYTNEYLKIEYFLTIMMRLHEKILSISLSFSILNQDRFGSLIKPLALEDFFCKEQ
jgi:hypothetical protein